mgnify:CR=1 FL=1
MTSSDAPVRLPGLPPLLGGLLALGAGLLAGLLSLELGPCPRGDADGFWRALVGQSTGYTSHTTAGAAARAPGPWLYQYSHCTGSSFQWVDEADLRAGIGALPAVVEEQRALLNWDERLLAAAQAHLKGPAAELSAATVDLPRLLADLEAAREAAWRGTLLRQGWTPSDAEEYLGKAADQWRDHYALVDRAPLLDGLLAAGLLGLVLWPWCRRAARWRAGAHLGLAGALLALVFTLHEGLDGWGWSFGAPPAPLFVQLVRALNPWALLGLSLLVGLFHPWRRLLLWPRGERAVREVALSAAATAPLSLAVLGVCLWLEPRRLAGLEEHLLVPVSVAVWCGASAALLVTVLLLRGVVAPEALPAPDPAPAPAPDPAPAP